MVDGGNGQPRTAAADRGYDWNAAELGTLRVLLQAGQSNATISEVLNRSVGAVQFAVQKHLGALYPGKGARQAAEERKQAMEESARRRREEDALQSALGLNARSYYLPSPHKVERPSARLCLGGCGLSFQPLHRFNRLCAQCTHKANSAAPAEHSIGHR